METVSAKTRAGAQHTLKRVYAHSDHVLGAGEAHVCKGLSNLPSRMQLLEVIYSDIAPEKNYIIKLTEGREIFKISKCSTD